MNQETRNKSHGGDESPSAAAMGRTEAPKPQHRPTSWSSSSHKNRCTTFNMAKGERVRRMRRSLAVSRRVIPSPAITTIPHRGVP